MVVVVAVCMPFGPRPAHKVLTTGNSSSAQLSFPSPQNSVIDADDLVPLAPLCMPTVSMYIVLLEALSAMHGFRATQTLALGNPAP